MKKLKLKANAFQGNVLNREQLKKVLGGTTQSSVSCGVICEDDGGRLSVPNCDLNSIEQACNVSSADAANKDCKCF